MSINVRSFFLSLVIIAVLFFCATGTTTAYADGGTTTDTPPTETTNECTSDSTSSECSSDAAVVDPAATSEPVATEVAVEPSVEPAATEVPASDGSVVSPEATALPVTEEAAPATEAPVVSTEEATAATEEPAAAAEVAPAPAADTTVLDAVPDNTTVAVLNADGQSEPLATQAAADAIAITSDPIWCPAGQAPTPSLNGCTQSFASFNLLLNFLSANPAGYQGAGTIYVQQGNYQGGESSVDFNNYNLSNISNASLTIAGGWDPASNTVTTTTFNNTSIVIGSNTNPWGGSLTINNISVNNTSGTGITLNSQADISLANVNVTNSTNGAGADLTAVGNVTIESSNFTRNKTAGVMIRHANNVAIRNSTFSNPANARRQAIGVDIIADGSVALQNVLADQNRNVGANINAGGFVTISGTNSFSGTKNIVGSSFLGYGLQVVTPSGIALQGVTANDNFLWGASLNAGGNVTIVDSFFNANTTASPGFIDDTGLLVTSGGTVTLNNVEANNNRLIGATINAAGDVSINNSRFQNNNGLTFDSAGNPKYDGDGLLVDTLGSIFINGVTATANTQVGAHLKAGGDVSISNSDFSGQTSGVATAQTGRGLEVISGGFVILDHVTLNNNQTFGANIQAANDVFLDTITATGNGTNGVEVVGQCTNLFLINGTYTTNGQYGLSLTNMKLTQTGTPVFGSNGVGDIFQDPGTCIFPAASLPTPPTPPVENPGSTPTDPTAPAAPATGSTVSMVSNSNSVTANAAPGSTFKSTSALGKMTLKGFLAGSNLAGSNNGSIFIGKYVFVYSMYGVQIFVYEPDFSENIAMVEPRTLSKGK
jgi:parallel beta helix pectate lyase-like protein